MQVNVFNLTCTYSTLDTHAIRIIRGCQDIQKCNRNTEIKIQSLYNLLNFLFLKVSTYYTYTRGFLGGRRQSARENGLPPELGLNGKLAAAAFNSQLKSCPHGTMLKILI